MNLADLELELERLHLEPGDILVFTTERILYPHQVHELRTRLLEAVGDPTRKVLVLSDGCTLTALTRADLDRLVENPPSLYSSMGVNTP